MKMKYTIELTNKQKALLESLLEIIHRHIGFNAKLEPVKIVAMGDTQAYKQGFEDGKADAVYNTDLIDELKQAEYTRGLEDGYEGYKYLNHWFCSSCFYEDEDNLFPEYKRRDPDTCCLEDIIADVGFAETLDRVRTYEKKKQTRPEIENYHKLVDTLRTVTDEYPRETIISALSEFGIEVNESEEK